MSLILDALKKLEQEKAERRAATVNVAAEILQTERPQRRRRGTALWVVAAVSASLAFLIAFALRGGRNVPKAPPLATASPATGPAAPLPAPPAVPPRPPQETSPPAPAAVPAPPPSADRGREAPLLPHAEPAARATAAPQTVSRPQPARTAAKKDPDVLEDPSHASVLQLHVLGIVWQEDRSARRAFVNGTIAAEGSIINGARIVEIYPDRIRFSQEGTLFDIPLEKSP